jgi:nicotinate phosphoribosyltransferase
MRDTIGAAFAGTSNAYLAYKHDFEAIGTNGHELPMALAAMAANDEELRAAQYRLLELWQESYKGELLILLPDTFGTTQFLLHAPGWVADWTGQRIDSKDAYTAGDEYIAWLAERGRNPLEKRLIASDALDVEQILGLHAYFGGRIRFSVGWGTLLTNDFRQCDPLGSDHFDPFSLVCKLSDVEGKPTVKLSDNTSKAMGMAAEVDRYRRVFGLAGVTRTPVTI